MIMAKQLITLVFALWLSASLCLAESPWDQSYFTNLEVVDQNGRTLHFYDDVLKDNQVVISFFYTSCKEICPVSTARLARVDELLGKRRNLKFIAISVDPENDTPEKLKSFGEAFGLGANWILLTGKPDNLKTIAERLGNREEYKEQHRNEIVLGNPATGEWSRNSAFIDPERLSFDILQLDPDWRDKPRDNSKDNIYNNVRALPDHPGEGLFRKLCSSCHTVGVGTRIGPDLRNVNERRSEQWLVQFITKPGKMLSEKDPIAVALDNEFPVAVMPSLGVTESDARDLVAYLKFASLAIMEGQDLAAHEHHEHDHSQHKHETND
jgi:protein SCO1